MRAVCSSRKFPFSSHLDSAGPYGGGIAIQNDQTECKIFSAFCKCDRSLCLFAPILAIARRSCIIKNLHRFFNQQNARIDVFCFATFIRKNKRLLSVLLPTIRSLCAPILEFMHDIAAIEAAANVKQLKLASVFNNRDFSDATIVVGETKFKASAKKNASNNCDMKI